MKIQTVEKFRAREREILLEMDRVTMERNKNLYRWGVAHGRKRNEPLEEQYRGLLRDLGKLRDEWNREEGERLKARLEAENAG